MSKKTDPNNYCVYAHICPNGKVYIGMTGMVLKERWNQGRGYMQAPAFWKAIEQFGWENIQHIVLIDGIPKEVAKICEATLIKKYRSTEPEYGYNILIGANHTEESKRKNRLAHMGKQYHLGFKNSEESRKKMSMAKLGKPLTEAQKTQLDKLHEHMRKVWRNRRLMRENL